jgi:hypothetical protein
MTRVFGYGCFGLHSIRGLSTNKGCGQIGSLSDGSHYCVMSYVDKYIPSVENPSM